MKKHVGSPSYPIWLLGDSNPKRWQEYLEGPFDPRHPIRHNIWTSILEEVQDHVFRSRYKRVDTSKLYIRNAVEDSDLRPNRSQLAWDNRLESEVAAFRNDLVPNRPAMLFCFGAFSYEFARRALGQKPACPHNYWSTRQLGEAFRRSIVEFSPSTINVIPLLHRSISGGHFLKSHENFCCDQGNNYFEYVGVTLAEKLLENEASLNVWILETEND